MVQRITALLLIALQTAEVEYALFRFEWYPALIAALAVVAAPGWMQVPLSRRSQIAGGVGLAFFVLVGMRFFLVQNMLPFGAVVGAVMHPVGWFLLTLQAALLMVRREDKRLPLYFPLLGVIVMTYVGGMTRHGVKDPWYHGGALLFVVLAAAFWAAGRGGEVRALPRSARWGRRLWQGGLLAVTLGPAFVISTLIGTYRNEIDTTFFGMFFGPVVDTSLGFSTEARLGSLTRLRNIGGEKVALRVTADGAPGYMRGRAYDRYWRNQWSVTAKESALALKEVGGGKAFEVLPGEGPLQAMRITPAIASDGFLFAPLETVRVRAALPSLLRDGNGNLHSPGANGLTRYDVSLPEGRLSEALDPGQRAAFLQMPDDLEPGVQALAERVLAGCSTTGEKVAAVVGYFREHYKYELGIEIPRGREPLSYFLLEQPAAHCEYFASGAVALLRLGGVPARYVTGLVAAEENPVGGYWIARNKDAHAWAEAYDDAHECWVTVEPTVVEGVPAAPDRPLNGVLAGLWDYVKYVVQRVRAALLSEGWREALVNAVRGVMGLVLSPVGAVVGLGVVGLFLLKNWRRGKGAVRGVQDPNLTGLLRLRGRVDHVVGRLGQVREADETVHAFAARLEGVAAGDDEAERAAVMRGAAGWYRRYEEVRFRGPVKGEDVLALEGELPELEERPRGR